MWFCRFVLQGISNLQSSINCDQGLGVASLSIIYATLIFSAIFVPSFVIRHLGLKWTLVASMSCYTLYMVANFFPSWATLIPASILVGLGAAPLWSAKCTYLTSIGKGFFFFSFFFFHCSYFKLHNEKLRGRYFYGINASCCNIVTVTFSLVL